MNTKDLITNKDIVNNIADSLEDFPQGSSAKYDLWVVGYNIVNEPVSELFIYQFDGPEEAIAKAETIDIKFISEQIEQPILYYCYNNSIEYFSVEVDSTIEDDEEFSAGIIYKRELKLDGEYAYEEDEYEVEEDEPVVGLYNEDFELLEDGTLKVNRQLLQAFNKNDHLLIKFVEDPDSDPLPYKIVSKVIYADGDYYHCELTI